VNYHDLTGKEYRILDIKGPGGARKCVEQAMKAVKKGG
jgi:hypothetical protein